MYIYPIHLYGLNKHLLLTKQYFFDLQTVFQGKVTFYDIKDEQNSSTSC